MLAQIDTNLAKEVTLLWLKEQCPDFPPDNISIESVQAWDRLGEIDVVYRVINPVVGGYRSVSIIPRSFWIWAEAQIEFDQILATA